MRYFKSFTLDNEQKNNLQKYIIYLCLCIFTIQFIYASYHLSNAFPNGYVWGEIFIKYVDVPVRRGLVGSILYEISRVLSIKIFWVIFIFSIYAIFFYFIFRILKQLTTPFFCAILFFSPGLFAFYVENPWLYGRKDILILSILAISLYLACTLVLNKELSKLKKFIYYLCCFILYCIGLLIHEIIIFFMPIICVLIIKSA